MATIVLASARAAPGVTTTALGLALLWPRPALLVEADVSGGSSVLTGYLRGEVEHNRGLVPLAQAHSRGRLREEIWPQVVRLGGDRAVIPAIREAAQAPAVAGMWTALSAELARLDSGGVDVIVDVGRLGAEHGPIPLIRNADLVLLLSGSTLSEVYAARARLGQLRTVLAEGSGESVLRMVLVGEGRPYTTREVATAVRVPVLGALAWDEVTAEVFSAGVERSRRFDTSPLVTSMRALVGLASAELQKRRDWVAGGGSPARVVPADDPRQSTHV